VSDIKRSYAFYKRSLGLKGQTTGPWAEFINGSARLVLLERAFWSKVIRKTPTPRRRGADGGAVLAIQVTDVDALHRRLSRAGHRVMAGPMDVQQMGVRIVLLRDPDGHTIELSTMLGAR